MSEQPDGGVAQVINELLQQRGELRERREDTDPDSVERSIIDGRLRGLADALDALSQLDEWDLPEWSVGVENYKTEEWDWYAVRAVRREAAMQKARSKALHDDLGDTLFVYEVYGPMATDGGQPGERERIRGTAGRHTHGLLLARRWNDRAEENIETWGHQRHDTTFLALIEEIGEIAIAMEANNAPGGGPHPVTDPHSPHFEGRDLISEMAQLGRRTRRFLEKHYPEPAGEGDEITEYELHGDPTDADEIFDEVDDAAPLLIQLYWALERHAAEPATDGGDRVD